MPTYDYQCQQCGHRFERFQSMRDAPVNTCPECGGKVHRLIGTGVAVVSKRSGFHAAGYRGPRPSCGRDRPCCGRDAPCDGKPCDG